MNLETIGGMLDQIEALLGRIGSGQKDRALEILTLLDAVQERVKEQENHGSALLAEKAQFESVQASVRKEAALILREIGGGAELKARRTSRGAAESGWWWYLDGVIANERKGKLRRSAQILGVGALILGLLAGVYMLFLRPDPMVLARVNAVDGAQEAARGGDFEQALNLVDQGLTVVADDPELLILKGVLLGEVGSRAEAGEVFDRAKQLSGTEEQFYFLRAEAYLETGRFDLAVADAEQGVALNPQSANGFLVLGQCLQKQGNSAGAGAAYQEAVRLAEINGDEEIAAYASVLLAYLQQQP